MQPLEQKQKLTQDFIKECDPREKLKKLKILQEPLAVAIGQVEYLKRFDSKRFAYEGSFYNDPWISLFGKFIHPLVVKSFEEKKNIKQEIVVSAAKLCREVLAVSEYMSGTKK